MANTYNTLQGDTWDLIAWRVYGTSAYMDLLIKANIQHAETCVFGPDVKLVVPEAPSVDTTNAGTPPWRR